MFPSTIIDDDTESGPKQEDVSLPKRSPIKVKTYSSDFFVGILAGILVSCTIPVFVLLFNFVSIPITAFAAKDLVFIVVVLLIASVFLIIVIPKFQLFDLIRTMNGDLVDDTEMRDMRKLENDLRKTVIQIVGGFFILIGFYFSYAAFELNRKSQANERFIKAVDYLKSAETGEIGVTLLHKYVSEYPEEVTNATNALCDFIRSKSPNQGTDVKQNIPITETIKNAVKEILLLQRTYEQTSVFQNSNKTRILLNNANLQGARFPNETLSYYNFSETDLTRSDLSTTKLVGANFTKSNFTGANLTGANLKYAVLTDAILKDAILTEVNLVGANLTGTEKNGLTLAQLKTSILDASTKLPASYELYRIDLVKNSRLIYSSLLSRLKEKEGYGPEKIKEVIESRGLDRFEEIEKNEKARQPVTPLP